jgi:hypothetical protein
VAVTPNNDPPLIQPISMMPPPPTPAPSERPAANEHINKAYVEARDSIEGLRATHETALRDPSYGNLTSERQAEQRAISALTHLWQEPAMATALFASGSTLESMKADLTAQRYDRVALLVDKANPNPPLHIDASQTANVANKRYPIPTTDPNPELAVASKSQSSSQEPSRQGESSRAEKDPMRELLDRMEGLAPMIARADPSLARTLKGLSQRGADPDQRAQPGFRHDVAYALQDLEKTFLGRLELLPAIRNEMTQLALTAVGLTNERIQSLMQATGAIGDKRVVGEIRDLALEIGRRTDQNTKEIDSRIDVVENKVRLGERGPQQPPTQPATSQNPGNDGRPPNGPRNDHDGPASDPGGPSNGTRFNANQHGANNQGQVTIQHSVLDTLLRAMRPDANQAQPPWEPPATPAADRIAANERRSQMQADDRILASAERRGQAALEALQGFTNGEGAAVMSKIREAAKTEPGGMPEVLSEMREGGRFADLRKQFGNALSDDAGVAAAYDKAAGALAAYGKTRTEIEPILARRPDATAFTQRLSEMDAEIGKAAAATPSKIEGRSMMEDLTKQAAELLQHAVDAVKAMFSRSPSPSASSSPSPSP